MFYSAKNNGFYPTKNYINLPDDLVEITEDYHQELLNGQSIGMIITGDDNGYPVNKHGVPQTDEQQRAGMVISNAQARLKLIKLGLFDAIDKAILSMPRNSPLYVLWEYGTNFYRTDEHLIAFCTDTLKMTAEDIDALFI